MAYTKSQVHHSPRSSPQTRLRSKCHRATIQTIHSPGRYKCRTIRSVYRPNAAMATCVYLERYECKELERTHLQDIRATPHRRPHRPIRKNHRLQSIISIRSEPPWASKSAPGLLIGARQIRRRKNLLLNANKSWRLGRSNRRTTEAPSTRRREDSPQRPVLSPSKHVKGAKKEMRIEEHQ